MRFGNKINAMRLICWEMLNPPVDYRLWGKSGQLIIFPAFQHSAHTVFEQSNSSSKIARLIVMLSLLPHKLAEAN